MKDPRVKNSIISDQKEISIYDAISMIYNLESEQQQIKIQVDEVKEEK